MTHYYLIDSSDYAVINCIWDWCQYQGRDIPMYRRRITQGQISWLVECPATSVQSMFLLNFSHLVTEITEPRM